MSNTFKRLLSVLFGASLLLASACREENGLRNIESFYFPIKKLADGKVYEYRPVGNPNDPPMYWFYKSIKENGSYFLLATAYDTAFSPDQFAREERVKNGMLLSDFYAYEKDSTGQKRQVRAEILASNVFPFTVQKPAGVLLTSLRWQPLADSSTVTLVRNRQYDRDTTFMFNGKMYPAVRFNLRELVDHETSGHLELEYDGEEIYAEGIGLVYFKKNISKEWQMAYVLSDEYDMPTFETKFKARLGDEER
jgi:hypothetical protein